jgi:uncharacterized phiE125 gp8 family phage protein
MALNLVVAPAQEPVSLVEAKLHCKEDGSDQDTLITIYLKAAREMAEHELGRVLMPQTWELTLDAFPSDEIELPITPIQSIASVKYQDPDDVEQTLGTSAYSLDKESIPGWLFPAADTSWPDTIDAANAVRIRITAGYASAALVPDNIKLWILTHVATWFRNRESVNVGNIVNKMPSMDSLLDRYRVWRI